jgi:uncharacterized phiE125 gp8 family phage protein
MLKTAGFPVGHFPSGAFPDGYWPKLPVYPVSLDEVKDHLRVITDDDDFLIAQLILAASSWAEMFQRRLFITRAVTMYLDSFPDEIRPDWSPLVSVNTIKYVDPDGVTQLLAAANYRVDTETAPGRIRPAYGQSWPETRDITNAVVIEYAAGYGEAADVPGDIKSALMLLVGHWYQNRSAVAEGKITIPQGAIDLLWKRKLVTT